MAKPPIAPLRRVLLALEGSHHSRATVELLAQLPSPVGATTLLLTVVPSLQGAVLSAHSAVLVPRLFEAHRELAESAEQVTVEASEAIESAGRRVEILLVEGDPAETIVNTAAKHGANVVVVGSGPRLGNVASIVLRYAPSSVLIARSRYQATEEHPDEVAAGRYAVGPEAA